MDKYKMENSISSLYPDSFLHYGIMGTGILWRTEFCQKCLVAYLNLCLCNTEARSYVATTLQFYILQYNVSETLLKYKTNMQYDFSNVSIF